MCDEREKYKSLFLLERKTVGGSFPKWLLEGRP
jgi:hypothetical protein